MQWYWSSLECQGHQADRSKVRDLLSTKEKDTIYCLDNYIFYVFNNLGTCYS